MTVLAKMNLLIVIVLFTSQVVGVEFRIKYHRESDTMTTVKKTAVPHCVSASSDLPSDISHTHPAEMTIYRTSSDLLTHSGFLIVEHQITTSCYMNLFGYITRSIIADYPMDSLDSDATLLKIVTSEFKDRAMKGARGNQTTFMRAQGGPDSVYSCHWLQTNEKTSSVLWIKEVTTNWNIRGELIQPIVTKECQISNGLGHCQLNNKTRLIYHPRLFSHSSACQVTPVVTMEGILVYKNNATKFLNYDSSFLVTVSMSRDSSEVICLASGVPILASLEGELISFRKEHGQNPLDKLWSAVQAPFSVEDQVRSLTNRIYQVYRNRIRRGTPEVGQIVIPDKIDSLAPPPKRRKRSSIWMYPEHQRLQLLDEHISWGFSEIEAFSNRVGKEFSILNLKLRQQECELRRVIEILSRSSRDPYLFASFKLNDPSLMVVSSDEDEVTVKQGQSVAHVQIPDPPDYKWCDGALLINFTFPDSSEWRKCWLVNERGACLDPNLMGSCSWTSPVYPFYIPTYKEGSWDLMTRDLVYSTKSQEEFKILQLHFLKLQVDDSDRRLSEIENKIGNYIEKPEISSAYTHLYNLYQDPDNLSMWGIFSILSTFIIPGIILLISLPIINGGFKLYKQCFCCKRRSKY